MNNNNISNLSNVGVGRSIVSNLKMTKQPKPNYMLNHIGNNYAADKSKEYADEQKQIIDSNTDKMYYRQQHDVAYDVNYEDASKNYNVIQNKHPLGISMVTNHGDKGYDYRDYPKEVMRDVDEYDPYIGYLHHHGLIGKNKSRYVTHYLNIDSADRNKEQSETVTTYVELGVDPLLYSDIYTRIYVPDITIFSQTDKITIGGLPDKITTLRTYTSDELGNQVDSFIFTDGLPYLEVDTYNNTDINPPIFVDALTKYDYSDVRVGFSGFIGDKQTKYVINALGFVFDRASNGSQWVITITEDVYAVSAPLHFVQTMIIGKFVTDLYGIVTQDLTVPAIGKLPSNINRNDNGSLQWANNTTIPHPPGTIYQGVPLAYFTDITNALSSLPHPSLPTDFYTYMKFIQDVQNITRPIFYGYMSLVANFNFQYGSAGVNYNTVVNFVDDTNSSTNVSTQLTPFIGNVPVNLLNNYQRMYYTGDEIIKAVDPNYPITQVPSSDKFYINLFNNYVTTEYVWNETLLPNTLIIYTYEHAKATDITITFYHYGGIPTRLINSMYPVGFTSTQGYKYIIDVISTSTSGKEGYITIQMNRIGFYNNTFGGDGMYIGLINELVAGYPKPEFYIMPFQKVYTNVVMVKMISSAFPKSNTVFSDGVRGNKKNNAFYWQNLYDGDHTYSIEITSGTYNAFQLKTEIETKISQQFRYSQNVITGVPNIITVDIDENTDLVTFTNYNGYQSPIEPFIEIYNFADINDVSDPAHFVSENEYYIYPTGGYYTDYPTAFISFQSSYRLKIYQSNHKLKQGDNVVIKGSLNVQVISPDYINGSHKVIRIVDDNNYDIVIDHVTPGVFVDPDQMGGFNVTILSLNSFRIRFDYTDTFGTELGFRDVGQPTSITPYQPIITNNIIYEQEDLQNIIEELTQKTVNVADITSSIVDIHNALSINGLSYFVIQCNELNNIENLGYIKNFFYKINLNGDTDYIYDTYVDSPIFYNEPIKRLSQLTLNFYTPTGELYDFNGRDHSFVLQIVTFDETPIETSILKK